MKISQLLEGSKPRNFPKGFDPKYSIAFEDGPHTEIVDNMLKKELRLAEIPFKYWSEWNGVYEFIFKSKEDFEAAKKVAKNTLPKEATRGTNWFTARRDTLNK